jgi:hypothetical protein
LSIKHLAESRGLREFHATNYPLLCRASHANDGLSFIRKALGGPVEFQLTGDPNKVKTVLMFAGVLMGITLADVNEFFSLEVQSEIVRAVLPFAEAGIPGKA